jgi:hypothetical protein
MLLSKIPLCVCVDVHESRALRLHFFFFLLLDQS